jgi:hypothetical protein
VNIALEQYSKSEKLINNPKIFLVMFMIQFLNNGLAKLPCRRVVDGNIKIGTVLVDSNENSIFCKLIFAQK